MIHDMGGKYHHGDLRAELVRVSLDLIAEQGVEGFSVAQVAKRANVSAAAPYRHFPDRSSLMAAVAAAAACRLRDLVDKVIAEEPDPVTRLASAQGTYTRFFIDTRLGFPVLFADGLANPEYTEMHDQRRAMFSTFLTLSLAVTDGHATALELLEQLNAQSHGYGSLYLDGVSPRMGYSADQVVAKSTRAARIVIEAYRTQ
ncbi:MULTISPECIES: TetR/AcrR family transcriptional regulator [unclassified Amycolatopsis]|uniref:TetR/AcrR family transcriptional regulator n=1 Tax=unclassified Amycolatopsis TaxID=2618356 RepID=UPI0021042E2A|nr:TetR/AcrR family transcriptional regulator [Amycolatopsis sp. DSM 110486]